MTFAIVRGEFCGLIFLDRVWFDWGYHLDGSKDVVRVYIPKVGRPSTHHSTSFWISKSVSKVDASECEMIWELQVKHAYAPIGDGELMGTRYEVMRTLLTPLIFRANGSME